MSLAYQWFLQLALLALVLSCSVSFLVAAGVRRLATRQGWIDNPAQTPHAKKIHSHPVPLLGGLAVFVGVLVPSLFLWSFLTSGYLHPKQLVGFLLAGAVLMVGGVWDDIKNLKPSRQIIFPVLAALILIASGIGIHEITNPLGGTLSLERFSWTVFTWHDIPYHVVLLADLFGLTWLLSTTYSTKFLDGVDGLVAGVTAVGAAVIALLSFRAPVLQPETALLALCLTGACLGFLYWNWHPARLFLGESGSLFCGFSLGALAIISGGKIATALLILGVPLLDAAWVIFRRLKTGRSPFVGDAEHMHQRLLKIGLSQRQVAMILYVVTAGFGLTGLFLQGKQKLLALGVLLLVLLCLGWIGVRFSRHTHAP